MSLRGKKTFSEKKNTRNLWSFCGVKASSAKQLPMLETCVELNWLANQKNIVVEFFLTQSKFDRK